ncbi:conserved hypothetical protein [Uncinocarpus reesii 1704]|uniref:Glycosyl transferase CAP10 domain-containing protein n=1 Tax=Uncinocarpus reesii (strain UAMH 1704) TaxID=336963 RepID=C4JZS4_UNCRE|nr:uncharacterized protein UREG_07675 [Uncinocarpus reesii 1704]EEP82810.1 conserved hypothetical protein [Uncinocarpus reesii 1704]
MNSDSDNVPPILTQLIPAGHCACKSSTTFNCATCIESIPATTSGTPSLAPSPSTPAWAFQYGRDDRNLALNKTECQTSFPVRAAQEDHRRKIVATLSSIHRALRVDAPNIEFAFSIEDKVDDVSGAGHPLWVLARKASEESVWLMPDFGFWAWGNPASNIGPYDQVVQHIERFDSEETLPWTSKNPKLIWRGKLSFAPKLRRGLLDAARSKPWGDVKELIWGKKHHFVSMEDHCRYMFIAHVEGRSFSSSLKYRQACRSVVVAHKLQYIQHFHYLLQSGGPHQNFVEVERDFSDLSEKMEELLADPEKARRIAENSVKIFRQRYLTAAAEGCYWRELWDGWASVSRGNSASNDIPDERGLRYETFILLPKHREGYGHKDCKRTRLLSAFAAKTDAGCLTSEYITRRTNSPNGFKGNPLQSRHRNASSRTKRTACRRSRPSAFAGATVKHSATPRRPLPNSKNKAVSRKQMCTLGRKPFIQTGYSF